MADHPITPFDADPVDPALDRRLRDLASQVRFPATPNLAATTRARLAGESPRMLPSRVQPRWQPLAVAAVILVMAIGTLLALSSSAREAVAGWFDVPGIRMLRDDQTPTPSSSQSVLRTLLGDPVSEEGLVEQAPFAVLAPTGSLPGEPDERYLLTSSGVPAVTLIYHADENLPDIAGSGIGFYLIQFQAGPDSVWFEKHLGREVSMEVVWIFGQESLWIEGTHHLTIIPADGGTPAGRATANVLVWNNDGVTYRMEADLPRDVMIEIAESMAPVEP